MARLANTFSWSLSRKQVFNECLRRYYLHYYGSWGGWEDTAPPLARLAYRLKQMVTLEMWVGDIVHRLIESALGRLRTGYRPKSVALRERGRSLLNTEWRQSLDKRWRENAKHNRNLFEHYYEIHIDAERRARIRERLFTCIDNFCGHPLLDRLVAAEPGAWLAVEELDTFLVDRVPVFVKLDCVARFDSTTHIIDWKSGRPADRDRDQVACYALYAMQKWNVKFEETRAQLVYLLDGETKEEAIAPEQALAVQEGIVSSIQAMRDRLADPAANEARMDDFPMTDNRRICVRCNFHEICFGPGPIPQA